ncbi:rhodanese-related sulfurtransferase [Buchnera aphidicola]|uniref:tRNA uridine(34) hydroxylase n=1 Tax=Buchnera aphidicola (Cinara strobi) TaxID=1921549 RepID=A0A3B1E7W7_9GAMM|nr:rhodanese-related sulfurtransferase [Buchnera aphidicola]VAX76607.1 UPF0176 protein YceA [Buchnera aphidicola (Cinara strobi)]
MFKKNQLVFKKYLNNFCEDIHCKKRVILSFYKYFLIINPENLFNFLQFHLKNKNVLGRIYISKEGINAVISIPFILYNYFKRFFRNLYSKTRKMYINYFFENKKIAFWDLRIKIKNQLVSSKIINFNFYPNNCGIYLNASLVNKYLFNKNFIFVDMRNSYEYEIGHFSNSLSIPSKTFREQLKKLPYYLNSYRDKNIVLYCTGGIRCEKSTALLKYYGFSKIYHIYGGILSYIQQVKQNNLPNYFKGKIFVFDSRLFKKITNDILSKCITCKKNTNRSHINCFNNFCHRLFIQCKKCSIKLNSCCSVECRRILYKKIYL